KVVATALADGTIRLLDSSSGQELASLKGQSRVSTLVFSPDDKMLVSSGFDTNLRLWDVATGKPLTAFPAGRTPVVAVAPDGKSLLWAGGEDRAIHFWDAAQQKEGSVLPGHFAQITGIAYAPGGTSFVSVDADGRVIVWNAAVQSKIKEWKLPGAVQT